MIEPPPEPRRPWPAAIATALLLLVTLAVLAFGLRLTDGRLVFALDDPYIHMAIARNLALHGEWAVTPGGFEPASSSPLWTLLVAGAYRLAGAGERPLLVMNLALCALVVLALDRWLRPWIAAGRARAAIAAGIGLLVPLPAMALTGMEPPLQILLTLTLAWSVAGRLTTGGGEATRGLVATGALATACVLTRFESGFLVASLAVAALVRRRPGTAGALAVGALAAVAGYMTFALPQGGFFLPNPVLLKSDVADLATVEGWGRFLARVPTELFWRRNSHMTALLLAAAGLFMVRPTRAGPRADVPRLLLAVFIPTSLLHIQLAGLGWFFRYEAHLVALGLSAIVAAVATLRADPAWRTIVRALPAPVRVGGVVLVLLLATPPVTRAARSMRQAPLAMRNVYEQPYQLGRFVRTHFHGRDVAVNDLGAVGYFGGARVEDLLGLATTTVARARLGRDYDTAFIERRCAARGVEVALVHAAGFRGSLRLPDSWRALARWTIRDNVVAGDATVTVFATGAGSAGRVRSAVREFSASLPPGVRVELLD